MNFKGYGRKSSWPNLRKNYRSLCQEEMKKLNDSQYRIEIRSWDLPKVVFRLLMIMLVLVFRLMRLRKCGRIHEPEPKQRDQQQQ
jgi:hypothetical protein